MFQVTNSMGKHDLLKELGRGMAGFALLAAGSVCLGHLVNQVRGHPLSLTYVIDQKRMEDTVAALNLHVIGLQEFRGIVDGKKGIVLDARPEAVYRLGHVPGAMNLSRKEFEQDYAGQKSMLESNKEQTIAVYCSMSSCEDSAMVAGALMKLGYNHVLVFKGGWNEWSGAALPGEGKQ